MDGFRSGWRGPPEGWCGRCGLLAAHRGTKGTRTGSKSGQSGSGPEARPPGRMVGTVLRENAQPLPCPVDTEDSLDEGPGALVLESDLLLGQDLEFEEEEEEEEGDGSSDQLLGFERDSEGELGSPWTQPRGRRRVSREPDAPLADLPSRLHH